MPIGSVAPALRSADAGSPIDLIAWVEDGRVLLVHAERSRKQFRTLKELFTAYQDDLARLNDLPLPGNADVQLWVYTDYQGCRVFEVCPGGIIEVTHDL